MLPWPSTRRRWEAVPYAPWEASEKWCSWTRRTSPNPKGLKHLLTTICESLGKSANQSFQRFNSSPLILSFQPNFFLHSSWRIILGKRVKGATKPRGSYSELAKDNTPRLVKGLTTLKQNLSAPTFDWIPRVRSTGISSKARSTREAALSLWGILSKTWIVAYPLCQTKPSTRQQLG